jgi:hypothetical protein
MYGKSCKGFSHASNLSKKNTKELGLACVVLKDQQEYSSAHFVKYFNSM